jgi:hypothetical protein
MYCFKWKIQETRNIPNIKSNIDSYYRKCLEDFISQQNYTWRITSIDFVNKKPKEIDWTIKTKLMFSINNIDISLLKVHQKVYIKPSSIKE